MGKNFNKLSVLLIVSIFFVSFISAVPPVTTTQQFTEGFNIQIPQDNVLKVNEDYEFDFHIFNISNGFPINSGISCNFHLYDNFGIHIVNLSINSADSNGDYSFNISKGNFSNADNYYYYVYCNNSNLGGFGESILNITPSGNSGTSNIVFIVFMIIMIYGITLLGLLSRNSYITVIGGMFMMFLGVYLMNNGIIVYRDDLTIYFSYITTFIGAGLAIWAGIEVIQENM